uniref:Uncharacterized protein n=1 Tax=Eutreptiella gymnastica TaxID=73025 RepID=A0A7S4G7L6_9EUGL
MAVVEFVITGCTLEQFLPRKRKLLESPSPDAVRHNTQRILQSLCIHSPFAFAPAPSVPSSSLFVISSEPSLPPPSPTSPLSPLPFLLYVALLRRAQVALEFRTELLVDWWVGTPLKSWIV